MLVFANSTCPAGHPDSSSATLLFPPLLGQVLIFANSAESGMRARLFLEAFGIRAALLSGELPLNSRHHILQVCTPGAACTCIGLGLCVRPGGCAACRALPGRWVGLGRGDYRL